VHLTSKILRIYRLILLEKSDLNIFNLSAWVKKKMPLFRGIFFDNRIAFLLPVFFFLEHVHLIFCEFAGRFDHVGDKCENQELHSDQETGN